MNRLERENDDKGTIKESRSQIDTSKVIPYQKEEWLAIIQEIKLNLPSLSDATKRTLYDLTKHIDEQHMIKESSLSKETQTGELSLWERASYQPSIELTPIDIKTLYDLNSDQMTAKDVTQDTNGLEEIPDSCSEPELIDITYLKELKDTTPISRSKSITSHQATNNQKLNVIDSITSLEFGTYHNITTKPIDHVEISSEKEDPIEVNSSPVPSPVKERIDLEEENTILSSSVRSTPSNIASRIATPKLFRQFNISPIKLTPPRLDFSNLPNTADSGSLYATALSQQPSPKPKKYKTRIVKVGGDIKFSNLTINGAKIRKINQEDDDLTKPNNDIIEDSDNDENSISLIELTTLDEEEDGDHISGNYQDKVHSYIQVPSSQGTGDQVDTENILNLLEENKKSSDILNENRGSSQLGVLRYSQMSASQLRDVFRGHGLKSVKTKEKMISILSNAESFLGGTDATQLSQKEFSEQLFSKLTIIIKSNLNWHEKIASYEPIVINELQEWLRTQNVIIESDMIESYCDNMGICYTNKENNKTRY